MSKDNKLASDPTIQFAGRFVPGNKKKSRFGEKGSDMWFKRVPLDQSSKNKK